MNMLDHWAFKYGIHPKAMDELRTILSGSLLIDPIVQSGESEAAIQTQIRLEASR